MSDHREELFRGESAEGKLPQGLYDSKSPYFHILRKPLLSLPPMVTFSTRINRKNGIREQPQWWVPSAGATISMHHFSILCVRDSIVSLSLLIVSLSLPRFPVLGSDAWLQRQRNHTLLLPENQWSWDVVLDCIRSYFSPENNVDGCIIEDDHMKLFVLW